MIKITDLIFRYDENDRNVLDNVNMDIKDGEFVAVLGHNGSGKSTLARHMNGILLPVGGKVYADGMDTTDESLIFEIRRHIGMVFQNPDNQIVATTVEDDVAFAPENLGVKSEEIRIRVDNALKIVGMSEFAKKPPHKLSGGQKQRVAIAGVLAMEPSCIVLDEPTAMLDPIGRNEVMSTLKKLNREKNITVILITHNMDEASKADRIVVMSEGRDVLRGTPKEVFSKYEEIKKLSLDVPQITELMHRLYNRGVDVPCDVLTVDEGINALSGIVPLNKIEYNFEKQDIKTGETILKIENLCFCYSNGINFETKALDNINIDIKRGEYVGIIGHTGSGKTTLVQMFNGLLKPTSGRVFYDGRDIGGKDINLRRLRGRVGLVFQYPEHQLFEETVERDIAFGAKNMGLSDNEVKTRVREAAQAAGVSEELFLKSPFELSGGQKRRVAIAGVLAMKPDVLILDEPAAGLDPKSRRKILDLTKSMHKDLGITVIMVSHSMEDIASYAHRLIVMNKGSVLTQGTPTEVFSDIDRLKKAGLNAPAVTLLMNRLYGVNVCTVDEAEDYILNIAGGGIK